MILRDPPGDVDPVLLPELRLVTADVVTPLLLCERLELLLVLQLHDVVINVHLRERLKRELLRLLLQHHIVDKFHNALPPARPNRKSSPLDIQDLIPLSRVAAEEPLQRVTSLNAFVRPDRANIDDPIFLDADVPHVIRDVGLGRLELVMHLRLPHRLGRRQELEYQTPCVLVEVTEDGCSQSGQNPNARARARVERLLGAPSTQEELQMEMRYKPQVSRQ